MDRRYLLCPMCPRVYTSRQTSTRARVCLEGRGVLSVLLLLLLQLLLLPLLWWWLSTGGLRSGQLRSGSARILRVGDLRHSRPSDLLAKSSWTRLWPFFRSAPSTHAYSIGGQHVGALRTVWHTRAEGGGGVRVGISRAAQ